MIYSLIYTPIPAIPVTVISNNATISTSLAPGASATFWYNATKCAATVTESTLYTLLYTYNNNSWSSSREFTVILGRKLLSYSNYEYAQCNYANYKQKIPHNIRI